MAGDRHPWVVFGRLLRCQRCAALVDLVELPTPWIDADEYVCGPCHNPNPQAQVELEGEATRGLPAAGGPPSPPRRKAA